jgi:magnesium-transporting ATPase (P-type)
VFNAVIGLRQEAKAEESVKALAQMMKTIARVRRGGQAIEIDAEELVPGDVVLMEAGNRVPPVRARGRRHDAADGAVPVTSGRRVPGPRQHDTIFNRAALPGPTQLRRYGIALLAIIAVTTIGFLQRIFDTVELNLAQWGICIGIAASLLVVEELIKLVLRRRDRRHLTPQTEPALSRA